MLKTKSETKLATADRTCMFFSLLLKLENIHRFLNICCVLLHARADAESLKHSKRCAIYTSSTLSVSFAYELNHVVVCKCSNLFNIVVKT